MNTSLLIPNKYKKIGWFIFIPSLIFGLCLLIFQFDSNFIEIKTYSQAIKLDNTITGILIIIGGLLVAFSKEKNEDEYISNLRLSSLLWAVFVNYFILVIAFIFLYDLAFLNVMVCNMFTILIIFIGRFYYILYQSKESLSYAE
jgi:hypothetical protein